MKQLLIFALFITPLVGQTETRKKSPPAPVLKYDADAASAIAELLKTSGGPDGWCKTPLLWGIRLPGADRTMITRELSTPVAPPAEHP